MKILVTGGCGFIGSHFINEALQNSTISIVNVDCLTYAGNESNIVLPKGMNKLRYSFLQMNICGFDGMKEVIKYHEPDILINFAAESHVDNSIENSTPFLQTNILGVASLLNSIKESEKVIHFIQISTDEVYGPLLEGEADEGYIYNPQSPYAASKAAADHIIRSYGNTYNIPYTIFHPCNNFGSHQHDEKLIPTIIRNAINNKPVPIYGRGHNIREWIPVRKCCEIIINFFKMDFFEMDIYYKHINIGSGWRVSNIWLVNYIFDYAGFDKKLIKFVQDRKNHDERYAITSLYYNTMIRKEDIFLDLNKTIEWYIKKYEGK